MHYWLSNINTYINLHIIFIYIYINKIYLLLLYNINYSGLTAIPFNIGILSSLFSTTKVYSALMGDFIHRLWGFPHILIIAFRNQLGCHSYHFHQVSPPTWLTLTKYKLYFIYRNLPIVQSIFRRHMINIV